MPNKAKYILILITHFLSSTMLAQEVKLYADTVKTSDMVYQLTEDDLLLQLVRQQSRRLKAEEDSIVAARMMYDTTTAQPFHIGYADSIRIAEAVQKQAGAHPMTVPQYYLPKKLSFENIDISKYPIGYAARTAVEKPKLKERSIYGLRQDTRREMMRHNPELMRGMLDTAKVHNVTDIHSDWEGLSVNKYLVADMEEERVDKLSALKQLYSFWYKEATTMLQLTQNYVSKNWYQGGNTNFAVLGIGKGLIKYNNRKNIVWENTGEWRIGFNTVQGDTLRKISTMDDELKLYSKLGVKLIPKLNYSLSADFQTHFFNTWKTNTKELKTGPLTPLRFNIATGIDYQPIEGLSIYFAPLTYKLIYANDTIHAQQTQFSIPTGKKMLNDVGSSLQVSWKWQPVREIALESKFYMYTNYKAVELDLEVNCDFIINRFFSARLMLHPRYDNTVIYSNGEKAKVQFKELISIGFAHKFRL